MTQIDTVMVGLFLLVAAVVIKALNRWGGRAKAGNSRPPIDRPILHPISARTAVDLVEVSPAAAAGVLATAGIAFLLLSTLDLLPA
jgi:hypothetical protein